MTNIVLIGYGRMGRMIEQCLEKSQDERIIDIVDVDRTPSLLDVQAPVDVALDFSYPGNLASTLLGARQKGCALVIGTTGYSDEDFERIREAAQEIPLICASNYSVGVAVLKKAVALAATALGSEFDCEIIETHHNQKADAPSGTALSLARAVDPLGDLRLVYGRQGRPGKRGREIGVHAVRGGTVAGTHEVRFFGDDEEIALVHRAASRRIFAQGAVRAARYLKGRQPGFYSMDEVLFGEDNS